MGKPNRQSLIFKGVYEFEDPGGTLIAARVPANGSADLFSGTCIVIRPNQQALLIYKGEFADVMKQGTHRIKTENFPIITRIANWSFGFQSPLRAELWFFMLKVFVGRRWGTTAPVIYSFPDYQNVPIRAYGLFNIKVVNPQRLYNNLIGSNVLFDITDLEEFVQGQLLELFPQALSVVKTLGDLNHAQDDVSNVLQEKINPILNNYGLTILDLQVLSLVPSKEILNALDSKVAMNIVGNKQEYLLYKAANSLIENQSSGGANTSNDPMQLMLGLMLGKNLMASDFREKEMRYLDESMTNDVKVVNPKGKKFCSNCGGGIRQKDKFCSSCGRRVT